jgi:hypothetical protein
VHQWLRKGTLRGYPGASGAGRPAPLVSLTEVIVAANRGTEGRFPGPLRQQTRHFAALIEPLVDQSLTDALGRVCGPEAAGAAAPAVLRDFVIASMGTSSAQQEFTPAGVRMLAGLRPHIVIDPAGGFGRLASTLGLLVTASSGQSGFDSAAASLLGLLGCATLGAVLEDAGAAGGSAVGRGIAAAAEQVWGDAWVDRLSDAAYHTESLAPTPMTRLTASLTYLGSNRYLRQAQPSGVSITYARSPGLLLPESYYGDAVLDDLLAGRRPGPAPGPDGAAAWRFSPAAAHLAVAAAGGSAGNPFRPLSFELGMLAPAIHGVRRYCFSTADARGAFRWRVRSLRPAQRRRYTGIAVGRLAKALAQPYVELTAVDRRQDFDWWKDHIIRSSSAEIMLGLRNARARQVAHGLLVRTTTLPDVVQAADTDNSLRDRLRIYVKNLEFAIIAERYADDIRRGVARTLKVAGEQLDAAASYDRAEAEIRALLR